MFSIFAVELIMRAGHISIRGRSNSCYTRRISWREKDRNPSFFGNKEAWFPALIFPNKASPIEYSCPPPSPFHSGISNITQLQFNCVKWPIIRTVANTHVIGNIGMHMHRDATSLFSQCSKKSDSLTINPMNFKLLHITLNFDDWCWMAKIKA